jgi:hypothetical protein
MVDYPRQTNLLKTSIRVSLLMTLAEQVRIELVEIAALLPAYIAFPGIALAMAALVQEIKGLVRESYPTVAALKATVARIGSRRRGRLTSRVRIAIVADTVACAASTAAAIIVLAAAIVVVVVVVVVVVAATVDVVVV